MNITELKLEDGMKSSHITLLILAMCCLSVLSAREFREYGIDEHVGKFPELAAYGTAGEMILYAAPDTPANYNGIFSSDLKVVADKENNIRAKSLSVFQKPEEYGKEVFDAWVERLSDILGDPTAVLVEGVPSDHPEDLDIILKDFMANGSALNVVFVGKTSTNIVTLKRFATDTEEKYDVTVFMTDK